MELLETITPAVELITQDISLAFLPSSDMWAKQSGLTVIDGCNRLPAHSCVAEEFVNFALGRRTRRSRRHFPQDTTNFPSQTGLFLFVTQ